MNANKKKIVLVLMAVLSLSFATVTNAATVTLNSWDLVDSGGHLDWDGESNYEYVFKDAAKKYNDYKKGVIRKDRWNTIEDVEIGDYYDEDSNEFAYTTRNGKIRFNQYNMDGASEKSNLKSAMFVIGAALGLGKTNNKNDVMYKYNSEKTSLSGNDKASYDEAYDGY